MLIPDIKNFSQLHIFIQDPNLFPWLKRRQPDIRATSTPERISQRTVPTTPRLPRNRKIDLGQFIAVKLESTQLFVGVIPCLEILGLDAFFQTTGTVFASPTTLSCFG
jgi:hypothetical protein